MQMIKRMLKDEKGLTLIELLAVIVILGVIAAIAVPAIGNLISDTEKKASLATARQFYEAARLYVTAEYNGDYSKIPNNGVITYDTLVNDGYLDDGIKATDENGNKFNLSKTASNIDFDGKDTFKVTLSDGGSPAKYVDYDQNEIKE